MREAVRRIVVTLRPRLADFDTIVAIGHSGIIPAAAAAYILNKPLRPIHKDGERPHTNYAPPPMNERLAWVDDFIAGGRTFATVRQQVENWNCRIVLIVLYSDRDWVRVTDGIMLSRIPRTRIYTATVIP
jgi:adenine/guanine phosphoribosyltransferase-like PRPP-binding protein